MIHSIVMNYLSRLLRICLISSAVLFLILPFQNCSLAEKSGFKNFSSIFVASPNTSVAERGGDGGGFEGKGDLYTRTLPVLNCPDTHDIFQSVESNDLNTSSSHVSYKVVNLSDCTKQDKDVSVATLERSAIQSKVLYFNSGLFFRRDLFEANGNNYLEAWCRSTDQTQSKKFEIAVKQNYIAELSEVKVWTEDLGHFQESGFLSAQRSLNNQILNYHQESFDLAIDIRLGLDTKNIFSAQMVYEEKGVGHREALACRMGGAFDSTIWPAQMLDQKDIQQLKRIKHNNILYLARDPLGNGHLYLKNQIDNQKSDLLSGLGFESVQKFLLTEDESQIVFSASRHQGVDQVPVRNLYLYNFLSKNWVQLNGPLQESIQSVDDRFFLSSDSKYVVYRDGENLVPTKFDRESRYLKSVSLESLQRVQLHPNLGPDLEPQIYFALSSNQVLFSIQNRFYFNNYQGTSLVEHDLSSLYSSTFGVIDIVTRVINDSFGLLKSQLFATELASASWVRNNRQVPDRAFVYVNNQKFETLEISGTGVSRVADGSLVTDVLAGGSSFLAKNGSNQDVLIQKSGTTKWQGTISNVRSDLTNRLSSIVDINFNTRSSRLTSYSSSNDTLILEEAMWPNFIGPASPTGIAGEIYFWKYNFSRGGFSLFRSDSFGEKFEIAQSFLPVNHLTDFQIIEGTDTEGAKWAVVKGSRVDGADQESLANERSVFWGQVVVAADLYLVSLDGLGSRRINRTVGESSEIFGLVGGVQAVWPVDCHQVFFTVGDSVSTRQVFFWKDELLEHTK